MEAWAGVREKADELLIYANTLCIVRMSTEYLDHVHLLVPSVLAKVTSHAFLQLVAGRLPPALSTVVISPSSLNAELNGFPT